MWMQTGVGGGGFDEESTFDQLPGLAKLTAKECRSFPFVRLWFS